VNRRAAALLAALLAAGGAGALDWPVEPPVLLGTFGDSSSGSFTAGIELAGAGQPVWPVADGEVIFSYREGQFSSLPRGSGNMAALLHEGGIVSVYSHLAAPVAAATRVRARPRSLTAQQFEAIAARDDADAALVRSAYERRGDRYVHRADLKPEALAQVWDAAARSAGYAPLGVLGDTGAVEGPRLSLMILDAREKRFLNPVKPEQPPLQPPPPAAAPPVIEQVLLEREGTRVPLADGIVVPAGTAQVLVVAYDTVTHGRFARRVAPYRLSLAHSGRIVKEIRLESLMEHEGRLVVSGASLTHEETYADRWTYRLGRVSLPEGQTHLQVHVEGIGGAARIVDLRVQVNP
jgi:hypothetical protein